MFKEFVSYLLSDRYILAAIVGTMPLWAYLVFNYILFYIVLYVIVTPGIFVFSKSWGKYVGAVVSFIISIFFLV